MKNLKQLCLVLIGAGIALNTFSAEMAERPLHVLYLGAASTGGGGRGFGGSRTNYVYLPGQTLAPEAIYFDHLTSTTNLTAAYLKHFEAVVQVLTDSELGTEAQKMIESFRSAGNA